MKNYQTPNSAHSRKGSVKVQRQPLAIISNQDLSIIPTQCATYLQQKVQGLEMRVKNLNSQHCENRSSTHNRDRDPPLSPCIPTKSKKIFSSNNKPAIDAQSYYETIINKRLENIIKVDQPSAIRMQGSHVYTDISAKEPKYSNPFDLTNKSSLNPSLHQKQETSYYQYYQTKLHQNSIQRIQLLTKKLRKFKMIKDQNQDECAPSLAKIKCFCQEYYNDCFDFYRCTDLIALKYFIYLLLQEINMLYSSDALKTADNEQFYKNQIDMLQQQLEGQRCDQLTFHNQLKVQRMVVETQGLIQEIISLLQSKPNHNLVGQIESLNQQMKKLKDNMGSGGANMTCLNQNSSTCDFTRQNGTCAGPLNNNSNYDLSRTNIYQNNPNSSNYKTHSSFHDERNQTIYSSKSKSPYQKQQGNQQKILEIDIEQNLSLKKLLDEQTVVNRQLIDKISKLQSEARMPPEERAQLQKKIQMLSSESQRKEEELSELQMELQQTQLDLSAVQKEYQQQQQTFEQLNQRIHEISKNLDQVVAKNMQLQQENQQFKDHVDLQNSFEKKYFELLSDHNRQFNQVQQLQQENSNLLKLQHQLEAENQGFQKQLQKLQEQFEQSMTQISTIKDYEQEEAAKSYRNQLQEQGKIIALLTEEALYLGQVIQYAADILLRHPSDGITTTLVMLQKDLKSKTPMIGQKMKILQQFAQNLRLQQDTAREASSQMINQQDIDLLENLNSDISEAEMLTHNHSLPLPKDSLKRPAYLDQDLNSTMSPFTNQQKQQSFSTQLSSPQSSEMIQMLIIQAHTIEKMIDI